MFGSGVWRRVGSGNVRGNGSVIDDATARRNLVLHHPIRFLGAQKDSVQIHANNGLPLLKAEAFKRHSGSADSGIIEKNVQTSKYILRFREERVHRFGIADVGWYYQCGGAIAGIFQSLAQ
jgi:hypothetical protein